MDLDGSHWHAKNGMSRSIREIPALTGPPTLPCFCNLGVWLRLLLGVNGLMLLAAAIRATDYDAFGHELLHLAALIEPVLLLSLALLCLSDRWLHRLPPPTAPLLVIALCMTISGSLADALHSLLGYSPLAAALWAAGVAALLLSLLYLLALANSRALSEARLAALNARIRPHFLFNSLNTVLGLMRSDPRRAEDALIELSELMRALLRDNRELSPLSDEIALARQYLDLEKLRLGERLKVCWQVEQFPADPLVPPLLLQPLLENAVIHGIEAADEGGEILIIIHSRRDELIIVIENPLSQHPHRPGQGMALSNIRQRLMLYYDLEARLIMEKSADRHRVTIMLPLNKRQESA